MTAALAGAAALDRLVAAACRCVVLVSGSALLAVLAANVIARYVIASGGFDWAQEVPERLFPWFIMAGVVLAGQRGGHVAVEWLLPRLPVHFRRALLVAVHVLVAGCYAWLAAIALDVAEIVAIERSPVLRLPTSHGYWAIAAGSTLLALVTATIALRVAALGPDALPGTLGAAEAPTA